MNFTEEKSEPIELIDINKITPAKKRGRPKKATATTATISKLSGMYGKDITDPLQKLVSEKDKLKKELLRLSDYNPEIVLKPVNDKLAKLVEDMSIEELRERVRYGHRNQSSKMDGTVAAQTILIANQLTGRYLGCLDELNETSTKDKLLNECVKDYMCLNILDYIPNELKIGGLYGSHLANAYYAATKKKALNPPPLTNEARDKIAAAVRDPNFAGKMEELKNKISGAMGKAPAVVPSAPSV